MGKPAGRLGDIGSNHGAWFPTPIIAGSGDVLTNGRPAARQGDPLLPHVKPKSPPHGRSIAAGASNVFINGRPASRVGDAIDCGGNICTGSGDVFIGDEMVLNSPSDASLPDIVFPNQRGVIPKVASTAHAKNILTASDMVKISDQDRHAQCNKESAKSGAAFLSGTALTE